MRRSPLLRVLTVRVLRGAVALAVLLFATFLLLEVIPGDRALVEAAASGGAMDGRATAAPADVRLLRIRYGTVDPHSGEPFPPLTRFTRFAGRILTMDLAPPDQDPTLYRRRLLGAFTLSAALGGAAVGLALGIGILLGGALGARPRGPLDRLVGGPLAAIPAVPGVLLATLAVAFVAPALGLETGGLGGAPAGAGPLATAWLLARQLVLPVVLLALAPAAVVTRHVRDATRAALRAPAADALRGFGVPVADIRRRAHRAALAPVATLVGTLLPAVVSGSVVVENVFGLPGIGALVHRAITTREDATVLAVTFLVGAVVVAARALSDVVHALLDPRVAS